MCGAIREVSINGDTYKYGTRLYPETSSVVIHNRIDDLTYLEMEQGRTALPMGPASAFPHFTCRCLYKLVRAQKADKPTSSQAMSKKRQVRKIIFFFILDFKAKDTERPEGKQVNTSHASGNEIVKACEVQVGDLDTRERWLALERTTHQRMDGVCMWMQGRWFRAGLLKLVRFRVIPNLNLRSLLRA
ncbi:hypothetical protein B0H11DRAFT_1900895 [Mycena galericulata]|nr:hypothetical protein B0H11DRAFT_1900895 [Mycena galericulata]